MNNCPITCADFVIKALNAIMANPKVESQHITAIKPCWDSGVIVEFANGQHWKWFIDGTVKQMPNWRELLEG